MTKRRFNTISARTTSGNDNKENREEDVFVGVGELAEEVLCGKLNTSEATLALRYPHALFSQTKAKANTSSSATPHTRALNSD